MSEWVGGTAYIFWKVDGDAHHLIEWHLGIIIIIINNNFLESDTLTRDEGRGKRLKWHNLALPRTD